MGGSFPLVRKFSFFQSYFTHLNEPKDHSWKIPKIKIIKKISAPVRALSKFIFRPRTRGNKRATSTSKIKKIKASKKKRRLKGLRLPSFGSKPHSKGEDLFEVYLSKFSRINSRIAIGVITAIRHKNNNVKKMVLKT